MDTVFTFDWAKVYPEVLKGLNDGTVTLRDGVAYWTDLAEKSGIVQHMPLKQTPFNPKEIQELATSVNKLTEITQAAHATQMAAIGISTGIIVGAIVIQTVYLSKKIDKLQKSVDLISKDIESQNVIYFMTKMSEYFGIVESARVLLLDKSLVNETTDISTQIITQLSIKRNELMSLIDNLISYANHLTGSHLSQMLDFTTTMLDLMPKAIYIEAQLCDRYGKFRLANHLMRESQKRYDNIIGNYRQWCNNKVRNVISGNTDPTAICFHEKEFELKDLFNSTYNQKLLQQVSTPKVEVLQ